MQYYDELQKRLRSEWPEFPPIGTREPGVPQPLIALTSFGALAGGLAFIAGKRPLGDELAVWINGVLVLPAYRREGLGSRLIEAAQRAARQASVPRLYALTELPDLYAKLGWFILSRDGIDFVMTWGSPSETVGARSEAAARQTLFASRSTASLNDNDDP